MEPREGYSKILIEKNLKREFGAEIKSKGNKEYLELKDEKTPIYTYNGMINEENIGKITKIVSEKTGKKEEEIYASITKKPNFYGERTSNLERRLTSIIVLLFIGLGFFISVKTKFLTGFAISNIPNATANTGIFICILGIVGLLFYRFKRK